MDEDLNPINPKALNPRLQLNILQLHVPAVRNASIQALNPRVQDLGLRVWGLGHRVSGLRFRVSHPSPNYNLNPNPNSTEEKVLAGT